MEQNLQINENNIFELLPTEVKIKDELPRQRKEMNKIDKMAESISTFGQILPVIINRDKELIAGGRRLAACLLLGRKVRVCYKDTIDPVLMREMELEENIQREPLTPGEEALAVKELIEIKQKRLGKSTSGREGGFTLKQAAQLLGRSVGSVADSLKIAEAVERDPDLVQCKTAIEIKSAAKAYERLDEQLKGLKRYEDSIKKNEKFIIVNRSAESYLKGIGNESVDIFFTDPPYGIDIHNTAMTVGGKTGGDITTTGTTYDDSESYAKTLLEILCRESFRIVKPTGFAFIFCAPSHFEWLRTKMESAGWNVAPRPVVWIKRESGQNNQPTHWFSAAYEFILFARKIDSCLVVQGKADWIQCDPVNPSQRLHQAEKPVELCKELISRCCYPGSILIDPCIGSGAIIEAAVKMNLQALGSELDTAIYAGAVSRLVKLEEKK